ncbi:hypothetical protein, partial [Nocardia abscessus]|uniref:hypothetical protein n=1 Tax=Nocardia abscessus TaxID=120957 RepID=UPI0024557659
MPVDHPHRNADPRGGVHRAVHHDGSQLQRTALEGVARGDLLRGGQIFRLGDRLGARRGGGLLGELALRGQPGPGPPPRRPPRRQGGGGGGGAG